MSKAVAHFQRISPLADIAKPGRYGADVGEPGVRISVVHPLSLVMVQARAGRSKAVATALQGRKSGAVSWAGPDQWYVQSATEGEGVLAFALKKQLGAAASVVDQSHGRVTLRVEGPKARQLLAKGTPVDLHPDEFPVGKSCLTQMAHVGVHLTRVGNDDFELSVFRGFSESFWEWLTVQALEFGYQVS
jgi:methylglutamate dehydrogenase subunit D